MSRGIDEDLEDYVEEMACGCSYRMGHTCDASNPSPKWCPVISPDNRYICTFLNGHDGDHGFDTMGCDICDKRKPCTGWHAMTPAELRALRTSLGLSQQGLSNLLGVVVHTVYRWERGLSKIPPYLRDAIEHKACTATKEKK